MIAKAYNPGSVHVRLGEANAAYDAAFGAANLEVAANYLRMMRTYVGVFMTVTEAGIYSIMPGYATGDHREQWQVADDMEYRREYLLKIARLHGIYARAPEEYGDGSALEEEIPDV